MKRSTETRRCPAEIKANLQQHYGGMAERPVDKKASEEFNRPAYQARNLIRTQGEYLQENPNERLTRIGVDIKACVGGGYH